MGEDNKLPGDYVAGFIDGEGCFYLTYRSELKRKRPGKSRYFRWLPYFAITLREDDVGILQQIKKTLGCGNVYFLKGREGQGRQVYFGVQHIDDLHQKILPFFKKYPLRAKKRHDFNLWRGALEILYKNKKNRIRCSVDNNKKLSEIRNRMRTYKSHMRRGYKNRPADIN